MKILIFIATLSLGLLTQQQAQAEPPVQLSYRVMDKQAQDRDAFVQGLAFNGPNLILSTGGYGSSYIAKIRASDGETLLKEPLHSRYFGEGVTVFKDLIYQLTWRSGIGFVKDRNTLRVVDRFQLPGEAWGITHDGTHLIVSDGSAKLSFYDPKSMRLVRDITVVENGHAIKRLNELEYIDGLVWANIWYQERVVVINPLSGDVLASLDLAGLLPDEERQPNTDVLNGIAYDATHDAIWVTGKRWPWRYQLEILPERPKFLPTEP
jgi:glutamine cyclotransferase